MSNTIALGNAALWMLLALAASGTQPPAPFTTSGLPAGSDFIYGRVVTVDGLQYEGRLRFGGDEEAYWGNYFNGYKDHNPWADLAPPEALIQERSPLRVLGFEFARDGRPRDLGRPFMVRAGDIKRIEARGSGVSASLQGGIEIDFDVRVTLKSGSTFDLDRLSAGDFDDGVRVWDAAHGIVDLGPRQIRSIEFHSGASTEAVPARLHGTVQSRDGTFTGFLQWDREAATVRDELSGRLGGRDVTRTFETIRTIRRQSDTSAWIIGVDGAELILSGTRDTGDGNRGVYVDDPRYGRVLVSWVAFERVDFTPGGPGPDYTDYPSGSPLTGSVTTVDGRRLSGRLVFDLDESETTETLDAPLGGVDYTIPFGLIAGIQPAEAFSSVLLHSGELLRLENSGDLDSGNAGVLVFVEGPEEPEYVRWQDVTRLDLERPAAMFPSVQSGSG